MHEVPSVRAKPCMLVMPGIPRMHARQTDAVIPGIPGYITHPERIRAILPCTALVSADDYKESSRGIMQRRLRRLVDAERSRGRHMDSASPTTSAATLAGLTQSAKLGKESAALPRVALAEQAPVAAVA